MTNDLKVCTESDLITSLKAGEIAGLEVIYLRYCQHTHEYFSSKVDAKKDVESLVIEVFVSIWRDRLLLNETDLESQVLEKTRKVLIRHARQNPTSKLYTHLFQFLKKYL